jgi:hypothetical protein
VSNPRRDRDQSRPSGSPTATSSHRHAGIVASSAAEARACARSLAGPCDLVVVCGALLLSLPCDPRVALQRGLRRHPFGGRWQVEFCIEACVSRFGGLHEESRTARARGAGIGVHLFGEPTGVLHVGDAVRVHVRRAERRLRVSRFREREANATWGLRSDRPSARLIPTFPPSRPA